MNNSIEKLKEILSLRFKKEYGVFPECFVHSPGRVNIIGDHTDYNGGLVLPMAIDRYIILAIKKRSDDTVRVVSIDFEEDIQFSIASVERGAFTWGEYISGALRCLQGVHPRLTGFDCVISGNIPVGASLSSSAALELGILKAAAYSSGLQWIPLEMARIAQKAENEWVGMNCGIMDQTICAAGQQGYAILIDCRNLLLEPCPIPENSSVIILDTATRRGLIDSAYNERRKQCFEAATIMGIEFLRDGNRNLLKKHKQEMTSTVYLRAKHIVSENERVLLSAKSMKAGDGAELGRLMYESHVSLRDDFEVSSDALNCMVECAMEQTSCLGARMTGAGFAGCCVALVKKGREQNFIQAVTGCYQDKMDVTPSLYVCNASDGTAIKIFKR